MTTPPNQPATVSETLRFAWPLTGRVLYVTDLPSAKLAKRVPEETARSFGRPEIKAALDYSFERSPDDVRAYLEENFELAPIDQYRHDDAPKTPTHGASDQPERVPGVESTTAITVPADDGTAGGAAAGLTVDAPNEPSRDAGGAETEAGAWVARARTAKRPGRASIVERFAAAHGFRRDGDGRFSHPDGSWIAKTSGDRFPWEHRTATGTLARYYLPIEHCLDLDPLEIEADVWGLIEGRADLYALILVDLDENPVEITGNSLKELVRQERLKLYPAAYRLVLEDHRDS